MAWWIEEYNYSERWKQFKRAHFERDLAFNSAHFLMWQANNVMTAFALIGFYSADSLSWPAMMYGVATTIVAGYGSLTGAAERFVMRESQKKIAKMQPPELLEGVPKAEHVIGLNTHLIEDHKLTQEKHEAFDTRMTCLKVTTLALPLWLSLSNVDFTAIMFGGQVVYGLCSVANTASEKYTAFTGQVVNAHKRLYPSP